MATRISVRFPEAVWFAIFDYEPFPPGVALEAGTRQRLLNASRLIGGTNMPDLRAVTLTGPQADELETWLESVVGRSDAPPETRDALGKVREAKHLAG